MFKIIEFLIKNVASLVVCEGCGKQLYEPLFH